MNMNRHERRRVERFYRKMGGPPPVGGNFKEIVGDDKVRAEKCLAEIQEVLNRYDCEIHPRVIISPGEIAANIKVVARPRKKPDDKQGGASQKG